MKNSSRIIELGRRAGPSLLGCVLCAGLFVYGFMSGVPLVPAGYKGGDVSLAHHPVGFWVVQTIWLLFAAAAGVISAKELDAARKTIEEPDEDLAVEWRRDSSSLSPVWKSRFVVPAFKAVPAPCPEPAAPVEYDDRELRCVSPDGRYIVYVRPQEMGPTYLAFSPEMIDGATKQVLFHPAEPGWTLENAVWQTASLVAMTLRKYPGDHAPIGATFDMASHAALIDGISVEPFTDPAKLGRALKEAYQASKSAPQPAAH